MISKKMTLAAVLLVANLIPAFASAIPCDAEAFNATYTCPVGDGTVYLMKLTRTKVGGYDVINIEDNEYNQEFVSDTSKYRTTPLGQAIAYCSDTRFTVDIYAGTGNSTVQSQIRINGQDLTSKAVRVSKFIRHPNQSAVDRSVVCLKNK